MEMENANKILRSLREETDRKLSALSLQFGYIIFKNDVPHFTDNRDVSITRNNQSMLFRKIIAV